MCVAVDCGHTDIVELLVRKGAEVNGTHTASCWTCLHQAAYKGHSDIVRILVGVCRLEVFDDHMITPLFVAAQYGQKQCLQILADAGTYLCALSDLKNIYVYLKKAQFSQNSVIFSLCFISYCTTADETSTVKTCKN